jgi:hypothetical protein
MVQAVILDNREFAINLRLFPDLPNDHLDGHILLEFQGESLPFLGIGEFPLAVKLFDFDLIIRRSQRTCQDESYSAAKNESHRITFPDFGSNIRTKRNAIHRDSDR